MTANGDDTFRFGKHKGRTFADVFNNEKGYVKWVMTLDNCNGAMLDFQGYCKTNSGGAGVGAGQPQQPGHLATQERPQSFGGVPQVAATGVGAFGGMAGASNPQSQFGGGRASAPVNAPGGYNNPTSQFGASQVGAASSSQPAFGGAQQFGGVTAGSGPSQFGAAPSQFGAAPSQFGAAPSQFGAAPSQFGAAPAQFGAAPTALGKPDG
eukprot:g17874.t1